MREYAKAVAGFRWPDLVPFNWAIDWFDAELANAANKDRCGLWIVDVASGRETRLTFGELSHRSNQVANWLSQQGLKRGDHLLSAAFGLVHQDQTGRYLVLGGKQLEQGQRLG